jgi:hypothetical protein
VIGSAYMCHLDYSWAYFRLARSGTVPRESYPEDSWKSHDFPPEGILLAAHCPAHPYLVCSWVTAMRITQVRSF